MNVTITRITNSYRRTVNGAWISGGSETTQHVVPESEALRWVMSAGASTFTTVTWPDGHQESFDYGTGVSTLWGPAKSRLYKPGIGRMYDNAWAVSSCY
jgi:hypothetical protein